MASYTVAAGARGVHAKALAANVADTVTFTDDVDFVEVTSDGAAAVYVTDDGTVPTVGGAGTWELPAGVRSVLTVPVPGEYATRQAVVSVISAGAATYGVVSVPKGTPFGLRVGPSSPQLVETRTPVQTAFTYGTYGGLSLVTGWTEGGYTYTVARNSDGTVSGITRA